MSLNEIHSGASHGDSSDCQTGGCVPTPVSAPWVGSERESEKTALWRYAVTSPDGTPFAKVVSDVFDTAASAGAEYQLARRFYQRHSEHFIIERRQGILWVEPKPSAFHLSKQYASRKTTRGESDSSSNRETGSKLEPQYPKDRVKSILNKRVRLDDGSDGVDLHDYRPELLKELATERANIDDKWTIYERLRGSGQEYLLVPYLTRFNDSSKAGDVQSGFNFALETTAEQYHNAVVLTVTVDPKRHESHAGALESITENKGRLLSWLSTEYQLGYRPESLSVLEFQENGLPHYHIVLFGCTWLTSQEQLSAKWSDLGVGSVVDVRSVGSRNGSWLMHKDGVTTTLKDYLGKSIQELVDLAGMDTEEIQQQAHSGDVHLWRQALYWATERQYYSCSPSLKESKDGDTLPHVSVWSFVGVAKYNQIPSHVVDNALRIDRPPPD